MRSSRVVCDRIQHGNVGWRNAVRRFEPLDTASRRSVCQGMGDPLEVMISDRSAARL